MLGTIFVKDGILTGAFSVLFSFNQRNPDFSRDAIEIKTLEGDALGHTKDTFGGADKDYYLQCYLQEGLLGKSEIAVPRFDIEPVVVSYDTVREVIVTAGKPFERNGQIEVPISLSASVLMLKKKHFQPPAGVRHQLYGAEKTYALVLSGPGTVTVSGSVQKRNGVSAEIQETTIEVKDDIIH